MADIFHLFPINAGIETVYKNISTPVGLNDWWTKNCEGKPFTGEIYQLHFGNQYQWQGMVTKHEINCAFELTIIKADADWLDSKVGFLLNANNQFTQVDFYHTGWKENNAHYKTSNYCWAMYLRILKRFSEFGETIKYDDRLNA